MEREQEPGREASHAPGAAHQEKRMMPEAHFHVAPAAGLAEAKLQCRAARRCCPAPASQLTETCREQPRPVPVQVRHSLRLTPGVVPRAAVLSHAQAAGSSGSPPPRQQRSIIARQFETSNMLGFTKECCPEPLAGQQEVWGVDGTILRA